MKPCDNCKGQIQRELDLLSQMSTAILEGEDIKDILKMVLKVMSEHMGLVRGTITIMNRKTGTISIQEAFGISEEEMARGIYKPGEGITGKVVESGRPIVVPEISKEPRFLDRTGSRKKEKELSFISVPIKAGKVVIGTLNADRKFAQDLPLDEDLRLLSIIAAMISQAVRLYQSQHEERQNLIEENIRLQQQLKMKFKPSNIIGNSKVMDQVFSLIEKISSTNATVLILGESGVGKELVAHAIHYNSNRADKPFVKLNCAALPESIIESELFGHERGAFTGALATRKGRFELADGGTIFLDEIGEIGPAIQVKLLRVLQEKEFERVGGSETRSTDVRIIAATNRNLEEKIKTGEFREDLYYRLHIIPITVPPLRERKTDILLLANHFIEKYSNVNGKHVKRISTPAIDMLISYHWPGNVRELENCIEHAVILSEDDVIHGYHLPPTLQMAHPKITGGGKVGSLQKQIDAVEYELLVEALKGARGNLSKAADELGLTNRMIGLRAKKYNINFKDFRTL